MILSLADIAAVLAAVERLERRRVVTTSASDAEECCGLDRDDDGFCVYRPGHPIYIGTRTGPQ